MSGDQMKLLEFAACFMVLPKIALISRPGVNIEFVFPAETGCRAPAASSRMRITAAS